MYPLFQAGPHLFQNVYILFQIIDEALILADLFDLNELSALQLILLGEERLCDHPGLTRGLVAVLTYYDTRKTVVETLRALILGERYLHPIKS